MAGVPSMPNSDSLLLNTNTTRLLVPVRHHGVKVLQKAELRACKLALNAFKTNARFACGVSWVPVG